MPTRKNDSKNDPLDPRVFDVSKPGKTPPSDSGKPVIVSHKPMVKDPMMSGKNEAASDMEQGEPKKEPIASRVGITIKPLEGQEKSIASEKETDAPKSDKTSPAETKEKPDAKKPEPVAPEEPAEAKDKEEEPAETTQDGSGIVDAVADSAKSGEEQKEVLDPNAPPPLSPEETARQEEVKRLIAERTYNVPIGEPHRSKNLRHFLIFILVLILLAAVGFELAIDAGLIESEIPPVVDLIDN